MKPWLVVYTFTMNSKNITGIATVMRGVTSYTTAVVYQQSGEFVNCKTCAGTSNENEAFMGSSANTCVRAGCGWFVSRHGVVVVEADAAKTRWWPGSFLWHREARCLG